MLKIDGSIGEGGGQILRTSLALSSITNTPVHIFNIRAKRKKPGLMRQHLTCVQAAGQICNAKISGDQVNSQEITFEPDGINAGEYHFAIGTAGSTSLVLQTILYPLLYAKGKSRVVITGGTHNDMSPPFEFIVKSFLPILKQMGANVSLKLSKAGFYPAGGGSIELEVHGPIKWQSLKLLERGSLVGVKLVSVLGKLPETIAEREFRYACRLLEDKNIVKEVIELDSVSPGNLFYIQPEYKNLTCTFTGFGRLGASAEQVAKETLKEYKNYLKSDAPVCVHLADQLLLPIALGKGGSFRLGKRSLHFDTNVEVIQKFLNSNFHIDSGKNSFKVKVNP